MLNVPMPFYGSRGWRCWPVKVSWQRVRSVSSPFLVLLGVVRLQLFFFGSLT